MRVSIICTGTELLKGTTVNTNLAFIGRELGAIGVVPMQALVVGDRAADLRRALESLASDSDLIITTGGLGPTHDDLTRNTVCEFLRLKLRRDPEIERNLIRRWYQRYQNAPGEAYLSQADIPENSVVLSNSVGTAPGLWIKAAPVIVLLPGPPAELNPMFGSEVLPLLKKLVGPATFTSGFMVAATAELVVQEKVVPLVRDLPVSLAYCASFEGVKVFFSGPDVALVKAKAAEAKKLFGDAVLADDELSVAAEISGRLRRLGYTFGTAESCTGGMIAAAITELPGASQFFFGGIVAYDNAVKTRLLGVPELLLERHGAVSAECVRAMAAGAAKALAVDAAVAVSGIAGPDGGSPEKPVGLVYTAAVLHDEISVSKNIFPGSREAIRERTKIRALLLLRELLLKKQRI
ncbi:MAG: CinA family nicotinamide mononucleotide deamidase-related protein [Victivallaceae bacterium]|nr:CinA family nicotinamide mononucleotide deamidase-related protein [Victivallaceae bacterium]